MKITLENKEFNLNIDRAKELGVLTEVNSLENHKFQVGDVFHSSRGDSPLLLIKSDYYDTRYQFVGREGLKTWANGDFKDGVSLDGIREYLIHRNYKFIRNINNEVLELVAKK